MRFLDWMAYGTCVLLGGTTLFLVSALLIYGGDTPISEVFAGGEDPSPAEPAAGGDLVFTAEEPWLDLSAKPPQLTVTGTWDSFQVDRDQDGTVELECVWTAGAWECEDPRP